jgi:hypothetical protein
MFEDIMFGLTALMVSWLACLPLSVLEHGFETHSGQTKDGKHGV